jgi:hypothetical protein
MAEPGDPPPRNDLGDDHDDDLIGFASPASLQGRTREPEPVPESLPEPEPEDAFEPPVEAEPPAPPEPTPVEAGSIFQPSREFSTRRRRRDEPVDVPGGGMGLYAVYALILFAVPTLGVSAAIALFAVTGRAGPQDPV